MRGLLVLLTLLLTSQTAPREVMVLDLTEPLPARPNQAQATRRPIQGRSFVFVSVRGGGGGGPQQWPIRTTLLGITPGPEPERWTVEVRLEALREVQLPRSFNQQQVDPDPTVRLPSLRQMSFFLELVEPEGQTRLTPTSESDRAVYGSDLAPGSLFTLQAGESIRVRYTTDVRELIRRAKPGEPITVRARARTFAGSYNHPALRSENVLQVTPQ